MTTPVVVPIESEYEKLKAPIQEIIAFTNTIDERYREKCFEVLLNFYLNRHITDTSATTEVAALPKTEPTSTVATVPLAIRAFLTQNNISEEAIKKLFLMEKGEAIPIYKIQETKKATAQIQLTMLVALRNALVNTASMFEFSTKDVRECCKEHNVYDIANFTATFKKNANLFISLADEEHVKLSPEGKTELAEVITTVSK